MQCGQAVDRIASSVTEHIQFKRRSKNAYRLYMPTIEAAICAACKELNVELNENPGCKPNIAAAARRHSVNYTTLRNRFQGRTRAKKQKKKETAQRREDKAAERRRQRKNRNL